MVVEIKYLDYKTFVNLYSVKVPGVAPFASSERLPVPVPGITFYGDGWGRGSCGITLDTISPEHDGVFECTVSINGRTHKGTIEIIVQGEGLQWSKI